jgi:DNA-binding beta-propeller fold protein YncE
MKRFVFLVSLAASVFVSGCSSGRGTTPASSTPIGTTPSTSAMPAATTYHVVRHIPVGGEGGWDYATVDGPSHRLFLSHANHVVVVDTRSGTIVGDIPKTEGVHGIAIARELHRGFVSNGRTSTVTIFDLDSLKVLDEVKTTGDRPDAILFDPASSRVFTFNAGGKNTTALDAASGAVAGTLDLGGKPEFAAADGRGHVYVNVEDTSEIVAIDSKALTILKRWKLDPCEEPSGLAMDRGARRLFSGCGNKLMAISDPDTGRVVGTVPIGAGVDANAFDAGTGFALSSNGADGTLTLVRASSPDHYEVLANVPTQKGARTMALDETTHHIFLPTAQFGPPPPATAERPRPRPTMVPGTFEVLEVGP